MPLLHCNECHHEWEGKKEEKCSWCGKDSYVLEEKTSFELFVESMNKEKPTKELLMERGIVLDEMAG